MSVSYTPAAPPFITDTASKTVGSISTITPNVTNVFPTFGPSGYYADAGEVADCLNQLVTRIKALEAIQGITN